MWDVPDVIMPDHRKQTLQSAPPAVLFTVAMETVLVFQTASFQDVASRQTVLCLEYYILELHLEVKGRQIQHLVFRCWEFKKNQYFITEKDGACFIVNNWCFGIMFKLICSFRHKNWIIVWIIMSDIRTSGMWLDFFPYEIKMFNIVKLNHTCSL